VNRGKTLCFLVVVGQKKRTVRTISDLATYWSGKNFLFRKMRKEKKRKKQNPISMVQL